MTLNQDGDFGSSARISYYTQIYSTKNRLPFYKNKKKSRKKFCVTPPCLSWSEQVVRFLYLKHLWLSSSRKYKATNTDGWKGEDYWKEGPQVQRVWDVSSVESSGICRRPFRWFVSISPYMTPSKYRPWGFLGFKNTHCHVLLLQWLQTAGKFPQLGFHINIDSFFFSPPFSFTSWSPKISGVNKVSFCAHLLFSRRVASSVFFPWHISINYAR